MASPVSAVNVEVGVVTGVAGVPDHDPLGDGVAQHQGEIPSVDHPFDIQDNHPGLCLVNLVGPDLPPGAASPSLLDGLEGDVAHGLLTPWMGEGGRVVVEDHGAHVLHEVEDHVNWLWNAGCHVRVEGPGKRRVVARGYVDHYRQDLRWARHEGRHYCGNFHRLDYVLMSLGMVVRLVAA